MLIGHQRIWDFLIRSAKRDRLAHAYLFAGPAQTGKLTMALEFAEWLFCEKRLTPGEPCGYCRSCLTIESEQNPDILVLSARPRPPKLRLGDAGGQTAKNEILKNTEIGIGEIRDLQHKLSLFPYGAPYKIAIIEEIASLSGEAASALLKTLEEPSSHSLIILISSFWQSVLPTIISRCQLIKFLPVPEYEITAKLKNLAKKETDFKKVIKLAAGRPGRAIKFLQEPKHLAEQEKEIEIFEKLLKSPLIWRLEQAREMSQNAVLAQETLSQWLLWLRDRILEINGQAGLTISPRSDKSFSNKYRMADLLATCRVIQATQAILYNPSFNARLALEVLMTKI